MIPIVIVAGHSGSGKSTLVRFARHTFRDFEYLPTLVTDRRLLAEAVAADITRGSQVQKVAGGKPALVSQHAVIYRDHTDPERRVFTVRDGILLNRVHEKMRDLVFDFDGEGGLVIEWTTGPNVHEFPVLPTGEEPLYQDAESVLELFGQRTLGSDRQVLVIAVNSDLEHRVQRNRRRPDPMDPDDFTKIFCDGGELNLTHASRFPQTVRFHEYRNNYDDESRFYREMNHLSLQEIARMIEGSWGHPERR